MEGQEMCKEDLLWVGVLTSHGFFWGMLAAWILLRQGVAL